MRRLVPCPQCKRHVFATETTCPHCGKSGGTLTLAALAVTAGLALAACDKQHEPAPVAVYGPAPINTETRAVEPVPMPATSGTTTTSAATTELPRAPAGVYGPAPRQPDERQPKK